MDRNKTPETAMDGRELRLRGGWGAKGKPERSEMLAVWVAGFLLFAGAYLFYRSLFGLSGTVWLHLGIGAALLLALTLFADKKYVLPVGICLATVFFLIYLFLQTEGIMQGLAITANRIMEMLGREKSLFFEQYLITVTEESRENCVNLFLFPCTVVLSVLCVIAVRLGNLFLPILLFLPGVIFQAYIGGTTSLIFGLLAVFACFLICHIGVVRNTGSLYRLDRSRGGVIGRGAVLLFLLFAVCALLIRGAADPAEYRKTSGASSAKESMAYRLGELRYRKGRTDSFTQGRFRYLQDLELSEDTALQVTMDDPQSLYLKGFVGEQYTSDAWEKIDSEKTYEDYSLYYWMEKKGFDALNQLTGLAERSGAKVSGTNVKVENVSGDSQYYFIPYELASKPEALGDDGEVQVLNQASARSMDFCGSRTYTYQSSENLVRRYPELADSFKKSKQYDSDDNVEFRQSELYYREKAEENYLEIPGNVRVLLESLLGEREDTGAHVNYQEAVEFVRRYLESAVTYSEDIEKLPQGVDFLRDFLTGTKKGYSVHYATAAAMMFRYCGIPSRYVEGYLITPELVERTKPGETMNVTGKWAHAWPEIYVDGVGWIPVEVTPPYYGIMEEAEFPMGNVMASAGSSAPPSTEETEDVEEDLHTIDVEGVRNVLRILLILLLLCLAGALAFLLIRRYRIVEKRKQEFESENRNFAACRIYAWLKAMFEADRLEKRAPSEASFASGVKERWGDKYEKRYLYVYELCEKAAFSEETISEQERGDTLEYAKRVLEQVKTGSKWYRRLFLRYIKCLY